MVQQAHFLKKWSRFALALAPLVPVIALAQVTDVMPKPKPLKLAAAPLSACAQGLADNRFVEALDDHLNSFFSGLSLEERLSTSKIPTNLSKEERLQTLFSEIYSSDLRMKTNSLVNKFGYKMPFTCLFPSANGSGISFQLANTPCNDPDTSLAGINDLQDKNALLKARDLIRGGTGSNGSSGTQIIQACSLEFRWDTARKRYYAERSLTKEITSEVEMGESVTTGTRITINGRAYAQQKMVCPITSTMMLGCHLRLYPRSESHLSRLIDQNWMPAREAVVCKLSDNPGEAFDKEVARLNAQISQNPSLREVMNGSEKIVQSREQALLRLVQDRTTVSRATNLSDLRKDILTYLTPRPCGHIQPGAVCNMIVNLKQHRYTGAMWDTFNYVLPSADGMTFRSFDEDMKMGPLSEERSYHTIPGMVGRTFSFDDKHSIFQVGGTPSHRAVEMFCAEPKQ